MNLLSSIITYFRRIVKTPSAAVVSDDLIIDYINRFWMMDVDARIQLFDLKTLYRFQTIPGVDKYNMPLYTLQIEPTGSSNEVGPYPVYQGFSSQCTVNGIVVPFYTQQSDFYNLWPNYLQVLNSAATADGGDTYTISLPYFPAIPGHVDLYGIIDQYNFNGSIQDPPINNTLLVDVDAPFSGNSVIRTTSVYSCVYFTGTSAEDGSSVVVCDSGQFLEGNINYGLLMSPGLNTSSNPGAPPFGNSALSGGYSTSSNTVNYSTGVANITFPVDLADGTDINAQCYFYEQGIPRGILYYNNTITIRPPPNIPYLVELEAYLSPAAFLNSGDAIPFGYMAEYIARGAARKYLSDVGDQDQLLMYEPFFKEQEMLVWKRSQRQFTSTRTQTIFSSTQGQNATNSVGTGVN